jgi:hypothetical protein
MSAVIEYFLAPSDQEAMATVDQMGGPVAGQAGAAFESVDGRGIDPVVALSAAMALLTASTSSELSVRALAERDRGTRYVVALPDEWSVVLARAAPDRLSDVAHSWSVSEEFGGHADPAALADFLTALADLARRAVSDDCHLYCWVAA